MNLKYGTILGLNLKHRICFMREYKVSTQEQSISKLKKYKAS